jgi:FAD/FMN-containing dehydrogenase
MPEPVDIAMTPILESLKTIVGENHVLTTDLTAYTNDWRGKYSGKALAVVKPNSTDQVAQLVRFCAEQQIGIVPQGGNTSLVGGSVPDESGTQLIINLSRMNKILAIDTINNTMTVQAGCVLQTIQEAADQADRLFAVSLAAQGSCEIGGNISTNAGGVQVVRYGNTREQVLGLEVVLPDGQILPASSGLRKDNTGYDLKQLFIGAEGTLGIVTSAVLKLVPKPRASCTAWVGLNSVQNALALLSLIKQKHQESLTAFELVSRLAHELVLKHFPEFKEPFQQAYPWYVLIDINDGGTQAALEGALEESLNSALELGLIQDVVLATNKAQTSSLWALRENITEAQVKEGKNIKHDVALPISNIDQFINQANTALENAYPGVRIVNFGHLGDGNLHYNIAHPQLGFNESQWLNHWHAVNEIVHQIVARLGGSISAEHGIGQLKREEIKRYKPAVALETMRKIKHALDPKGIMNPGKVI